MESSRVRHALRVLQDLVLWLIILAGILGVGWVALRWYTGASIPQFLIDAGPVLLVFVTMMYIGVAGLGYLESRKERRIARESLDLHRRDIKLKEKSGIIDTITSSIDATTEQLQEDKSALSNTINGCQKYPELDDIDLIDKEMLHDIPDRYPDLHLDIPSYISIRRAYDGKRDHVQNQLTEMIPEELDDDTADDLLRATGSSRNEIAGQGDTFWQRLDEYSADLAVVALTGTAPSSSKGWIVDNVADLREALFQLRDSDVLGGEFNELENIRENLVHENKRISSNLDSAKESLKEEYNIRESEIARKKEELP